MVVQTADMERYLRSSIPSINLPSMDVVTVKTKVDEAIIRLQIAVTDTYDSIGALSSYWAADDSGSQSDSDLFLEALSVLCDGIIGENFELQGSDAVLDLAGKCLMIRNY